MIYARRQIYCSQCGQYLGFEMVLFADEAEVGAAREEVCPVCRLEETCAADDL